MGFLLLTVGMASLIPIVPRADSGWYLAIPLLIAGSGLGLLVSQLNNYTLAPISEERISEAAGVNSAAGSFGLSFGLALAGGIMLATLSLTFTDMAEESSVLPPSDQQRVAEALEDDAQLMSNTQLEELLGGNRRRSRTRSCASTRTPGLVPFRWRSWFRSLPALIGLINSFRMMRLPEPTPSASTRRDGVGLAPPRPGTLM